MHNSQRDHRAAIANNRARLGADRPDPRASRLELGSTRLLQKRYAEAEPLFPEAYASLKQHETNTPDAKSRAADAAQWLVQLYDGWGKKDQATEWRQKLDEQKKP